VSAAEVVHRPISFLLPLHPLALAVLLSLVKQRYNHAYGMMTYLRPC
jgi:hypothetical protein